MRIIHDVACKSHINVHVALFQVFLCFSVLYAKNQCNAEKHGKACGQGYVSWMVMIYMYCLVTNFQFGGKKNGNSQDTSTSEVHIKFCIHVHLYHTKLVITPGCSLVPRPIPSFSMFTHFQCVCKR